MSVTGTWERPPHAWLEDLVWHRRMFRDSRFQWTPSDALTVLLVHTRGRCTVTTPGHLRDLDAQLLGLLERLGAVNDALSAPLRTASGRLHSNDFRDGLQVLGLTSVQAERLMDAPAGPATGRDALRVLRGIPLPNPLTQAWELLQIRAMLQAAVDIAEDAVVDLVVELSARHDLAYLALLTTDRVPFQLQWRVDQQRAGRGDPGDPRRIVGQHYPELPDALREPSYVVGDASLAARTRFATAR